MSRLFEGYEIDLPFGPAAGVINGPNRDSIIEKIKDVLSSPAGAAKWGSLTWNGGMGNAEYYDPVYYHNPITRQTSNSLGLPNVGRAEGVPLHKELQQIADTEGKPLVVSESPGKGEDAREVLPAMASELAGVGARFIEVNYSCFNKISEDGQGREPILGYDPETMFEVDAKIVEEVGEEITIIRKLPPYVGEYRSLIPVVVKGFSQARGRVALSLTNTLGGQKILTEYGDPALGVPDNIGSLSGPAMVEVGRHHAEIFRFRLPADVAISSCMGVDSGREVYNRIHNLKADFTEGATIFIENERRGISYGQTAQKIAEQYAEELLAQNEGQGYA